MSRKRITAPPAASSPDTYYPAMPLALIDAAPDNPRQNLGDLSELAESMRGPAGVVQPLLLTPRDDRYLCVAGHRRRAAAELAGLESVPAIVRDMDEPTRKTVMLIENLQRVDLTPIEEARAFRALVELGWSQRKIAADVSRAQSHVAKRLSLLGLPAEVLERVDSGGIAVSEALELTKLVDHPEALERVLKAHSIEHAVAREVEQIREQEAVGERVAALEAQGYRVIVSEVDWWFRAPPGVCKIGEGWQELPLDPVAHAHEPCHAIGLLSGRAEDELPLCTDRARHPDVFSPAEREANEQTVDSEVARRNEERQAAKRDRERREAFALDLLTRRPKDPRTALTFLAHALVTIEADFGADDALERIAGHLGIWTETGDDEDTPARALHAYIDRTKADHLMQLACVLQVLNSQEHRRVWRFLESQGYELSVQERARLAEREDEGATA